MLVVVWFIRIELTLQELASLVITYAVSLLVWFVNAQNARRFELLHQDLH